MRIIKKVVEKITTQNSIFGNFFPENPAPCEIMWENIVQPDGPHDNMIQCMRVACCVTQATDTHSECVIRIAFLCNNGCTKAPLCCVIRILLVLLTVLHGRRSQAIWFWHTSFPDKSVFSRLFSSCPSKNNAQRPFFPN